MATYIEKTDVSATLSTWLYCNMWQLYAAECVGLTCYINWPRHSSLTMLADAEAFAACPNMFEWYFEQPHAFDQKPPPCDRAYVWEHDTMSHEGSSLTGKHCLQGQSFEFLKEFYRKNLKFNAAVIARGNAIKDAHGIDFDNTVAVSWRGTDSITDGRPRVLIEEYFPHIDAILSENPDTRLLATAEECGVVDELRARYPDVVTIAEWSMSPSLPKNCTLTDYAAASYAAKRNPEWTSPKSGYERGMQVATMIWMLSQCKYYIKNRSSLAYISSWLSRGTVISIRHPEVA